MSRQRPLDTQEADQRANHTWAAHAALLDAERRDPGLRANPVWQCLRMDSYEAFHAAFVGEAK